MSGIDCLPLQEWQGQECQDWRTSLLNADQMLNKTRLDKAGGGPPSLREGTFDI